MRDGSGSNDTGLPPCRAMASCKNILNPDDSFLDSTKKKQSWAAGKMCLLYVYSLPPLTIMQSTQVQHGNVRVSRRKVRSRAHVAEHRWGNTLRKRVRNLAGEVRRWVGREGRTVVCIAQRIPRSHRPAPPCRPKSLPIKWQKTSSFSSAGRRCRWDLHA